MSTFPVLAGALIALVVFAVGVVLVVTLGKRRRRSRFAVYGTKVNVFQLPEDGPVQYAQWLHPKETPKAVTQSKVRALRQFVREGDLVIDIGAHTGDTSVPLALAAGRNGCTLALEPNPYVFKALQANANLNRDKTNIVPLNFAATSTDGVFTFHYSDGGYCNGGFLSQIRNKKHGHHQPLEVQGKDFANYLKKHYADKLQRFSFLKIDTEGYDRQVLLSLIDILREYKPVIICEVYGKLTTEERHALFDTLHDLGYACYQCSDGDSLQGTPVQRDTIAEKNHFDMLAIPRQKARAAA